MISKDWYMSAKDVHFVHVSSCSVKTPFLSLSLVASARKVLTQIKNQFTVVIMIFGFTKSVRVFQMMNFKS